MRIVTSKTKSLRERLEEAEIFSHMDGTDEGDPRILSFPSLYVVRHRNPFLPCGRFVKRFDDGYEECVVDSPGGRLRVLGYRGPVFPHRTLGPFLMAVRTTGADLGSERVDRRRKMGE